MNSRYGWTSGLPCRHRRAPQTTGPAGVARKRMSDRVAFHAPSGAGPPPAGISPAQSAAYRSLSDREQRYSARARFGTPFPRPLPAHPARWHRGTYIVRSPADLTCSPRLALPSWMRPPDGSGPPGGGRGLTIDVRYVNIVSAATRLTQRLPPWPPPGTAPGTGAFSRPLQTSAHAPLALPGPHNTTAGSHAPSGTAPGSETIVSRPPIRRQSWQRHTRWSTTSTTTG